MCILFAAQILQLFEHFFVCGKQIVDFIFGKHSPFQIFGQTSFTVGFAVGMDVGFFVGTGVGVASGVALTASVGVGSGVALGSTEPEDAGGISAQAQIISASTRQRQNAAVFFTVNLPFLFSILIISK